MVSSLQKIRLKKLLSDINTLIQEIDFNYWDEIDYYTHGASAYERKELFTSINASRELTNLIENEFFVYDHDLYLLSVNYLNDKLDEFIEGKGQDSEILSDLIQKDLILFNRTENNFMLTSNVSVKKFDYFLFDQQVDLLSKFENIYKNIQIINNSIN